MEETLHALGGLLLKALPTFLLVVALHFYLKFMLFRPLEKVLKQRYEATEGARQTAEASFRQADAKAAEYEAALRAARSQMHVEQEQMRRKLQEERAASVAAARAQAEAAIQEAKTQLRHEGEDLKDQLAAEAESLSEQIAGAVLKRRAA